MSKTSLTFIIMCGLPGSGKSTLAKELYDRRPRESIIIDVDKIIISNKHHNIENCLEYILNCALDMVKPGIKYIIIDGLFTNQKQYDEIGAFCKDNEIDLEFHFFEEDREGCLWNDRGRKNARGKDSINTIKIAPLEKPDVERVSIIREKEVQLITHVVQKKNVFDLWVHEVINKIQKSDDGYLNGDTWSMGGTSGNCWGDIVQRSGDPAPNTFAEVDNIMMEICPDITFLQGRKIYSECVETKTKSDSDWYGGTMDYGYYSCNLRSFYDLLKQWGYIPEEYL